MAAATAPLKTASASAGSIEAVTMSISLLIHTPQPTPALLGCADTGECLLIDPVVVRMERGSEITPQVAEEEIRLVAAQPAGGEQSFGHRLNHRERGPITGRPSA